MVAQGADLHPGLGLLLPLGFQQGPGQALSMGQSWEPGLAEGAGVGLIIAALGFAWAVFVGVPLVVIGKRRGWLKVGTSGASGVMEVEEQEAVSPPGSMERLGFQVAAIAAVYLLTLGVVSGISHLLEGKAQFQNMIWGFHFIIGGGLALGVRALLTKLKVQTPLSDTMLGQISGTTVDFVTCAALAAVNLMVVPNHLVLILVLTSVGGVVTVMASLWLARRAFPNDTFQHAVMMFGAVTGTLPTGLALLRILDPEMKSSAPGNAVLGSAGSLILSVPLLLVVLPLATAGWPDDVQGALFKCLGVLVVYLLALLVGWRFLGPLRIFSPLRIWPKEAAGDEAA
jgi:ESS family glutamate:Na+ symporter